MLKKDYVHIPDHLFKIGDSDMLFHHYYYEFFNADKTVNEFVAMFFNIIRDFLIHRINEEVLSSLIHKSLFDERVKKYHYAPYLWQINDLLALMHELLDITWTRKSEEYLEYLKYVETRLKFQADKYQHISIT